QPGLDPRPLLGGGLPRQIAVQQFPIDFAHGAMRSARVTVRSTCSPGSRWSAKKYLQWRGDGLAGLGEHLAEVLEGAADVHRDGLGGNAERLSDLVIAGLALPAQQQDLALPGRQGVYRMPNHGGGLAGDEIVVGGGRQRRLAPRHHRVGVTPLPPLLDPPAPDVIQGAVPHDRKEVALGAGAGEIDLRPLPPEEKERLVNQVLCRFNRVNIAVGEAVQPVEVELEEPPECGGILVGSCFRVRHVRRPARRWLATVHAASADARAEKSIFPLWRSQRGSGSPPPGPQRPPPVEPFPDNPPVGSLTPTAAFG